MTKKEVQQRVLRNGKPLALDKFIWCGKTMTFSSDVDCLILNFRDIQYCTFNTSYDCTFDTGSNCTFDTGSDCTFDTGFNCTFKTGSDCTFDTGFNCIFDTSSDCTFKTGPDCIFDTGSNCIFDTSYDCTFKTGSDCTFDTGPNCTFNTSSDCVIVRRDNFQVIQPKKDETIQLCPYSIKGYLSNGYLNGDETLGKYIIADSILSKIISKKGNIYKVINYNDTTKTYLIEKNGIFSHGATLQEAKTSLVYKLANRDTSKYKGYTLSTELTRDEAIIMYMTITGACQYGTRKFVESQDNTSNIFTVQDIIDITKGQYGNETLSKFLKEK